MPMCAPMLRRRSRNHSAKYRAHLASPEWRVIRQAALARAGDRCSWCGKDRDRLRLIGRHLEVHHNNYSSLGHERPEDLTVLCAGGRNACHAAADRQRRAGTGRPPAKRRRRKRRLPGMLRDARRAVLVLAGAYGGFWALSTILPHVS
jgi:hypothetical protein